MFEKGDCKMFNKYNHLGFMSNFYINKNNNLIIKNTFQEIINFKEKKLIDPTSVIELINKNYFFADRTIIDGIYKTPWMAKPNNENNDWKFFDLPKHGYKLKDEKEIADELFHLLKKEIYNHCNKKQNIGILLSGGMDSRIVSGVLNNLIQTNKIDSTVTALNWGLIGSRDQVYAKRISKMFGWEYRHFTLNESNLKENIKITSDNGCQFSPIHLHAMPKIRELKNLDLILAASFGDSIGRAEYSGKHVTKLKSIKNNILNPFEILKNDIYKIYKNEIKNDIKRYRKLFPRQKVYQYYEIERQAHYMRKQLNPCMEIINQKIPVYQAFTSPEVYGFMWSIDPKKRGDKIYKYILEKFDNKLKEVPWSRTGKRYLKDKDLSDNLKKHYHKYGLWIRDNISDYIEERVLSQEIDNLNIFNMISLKNLIKYNKKYSQSITHTKIDETLIWLASLAELVKKYDIKGIKNHKSSYLNYIRSRYLSTLETIAYLTYKNII